MRHDKDVIGPRAIVQKVIGRPPADRQASVQSLHETNDTELPSTSFRGGACRAQVRIASHEDRHLRTPSSTIPCHALFVVPPIDDDRVVSLTVNQAPEFRGVQPRKCVTDG